MSQRWIHTEKTYAREDPSAFYYLSMEFLIGRSLANNVTNLLLDPLARAVRQKNLDWLELLEQEPDAGLGNGGLGRLAACFLDSMATMQLPAMGYGLRYEYGIFRQSIQDGWQRDSPDNWLRRPDPWEVARPTRRWKSSSTARSNCAAAPCARSPAKPSTLIGIPFDRPVVGYGGKTINTLRLWAAAAPRLLQLSGIQQRRFRRRAGRDARGRIADAGALSGRLDEHGAGIALRAGVFSGRLLAGRSRAALPARATPIGARFPRKSRSSSTIRIRRWPSPS